MTLENSAGQREALRHWIGNRRNAGKEGGLQPFKLERKWGTSFDDYVYYSQAPTRTQDHISTLQAIEKALKG